MRNLSILLVVMLCTSCALLPYEIQETPLKPDEAVVFDIDGTLTPSPSAIFTARQDAAKAVNLIANKGYKIIYLSARPTFLQAGIPNWLKENRFPEGSIHVPQTAADSSDPAGFKKRILSSYKAKGWKFVAAFGDSTTDFEAYADAGITHVIALKRVGASECQPGKYEKCWSSWSGHDEDIILLTSP